MRKNTSNYHGTTIVTVVCAMIFYSLTFIYLYFFQDGSLTAAQHCLSGGVTHYDSLIGAIVITTVLFILHHWIRRICVLPPVWNAVSYVPSFLILFILTGYHPNEESGWYSYCLYSTPLLLVLWCVLVGILKKSAIISHSPSASVFGSLCSVEALGNYWILILCFFMLVLSSDSNIAYHYRVEVEKQLESGCWENATEIGKNSQHTDAHLTMLRAYALSQENQLGERLFSYPVHCKGSDLLPVQYATRCLFYPTENIFRHLGAFPAETMDFYAYLKALLRSGKAKPSAYHYLLCAHLIDRDLNAFARTLKSSGIAESSLPRHYQEALVLYNHLTSASVYPYRNSPIETDYTDFMQLMRATPAGNHRRLVLYKHFKDSYWRYYYMQ
ncbi:MAG: DUF6057 family protein [Prevotella sp.]